MTDPSHLAVPGAVYGEDLPYTPKIVPSTRVGGWCGARQRRFLEAIADGETVRDACDRVGLSAASAYAFRRRANGRAFDLGWRAADLLARERVAADLLARATEGQEVQVTRPDGSTVTRHSYDNRLAVTMLNRLDRYADAAERTAPGHAARLVAGDFDSYLDLVGEEGGPARAGLYMLARNADGDAVAAELEPVIALARADRRLRCGTAAGEVATADLDPARRAEWTADQWARAEAAGLIALAPPPPPEPEVEEPASTRQPCSTCSGSEGVKHPALNARDLVALEKLNRLGLGLDGEIDAGPDPLLDSPVWWDSDERRWLTRFPPPDNFDGEENREFGDEMYHRTLTPEEDAVAMRRLAGAFGIITWEDAEKERDEWFGAGGESADLAEIEATPPSPAGEPGVPKRRDSFDVEDEAALVLFEKENATSRSGEQGP